MKEIWQHFKKINDLSERTDDVKECQELLMLSRRLSRMAESLFTKSVSELKESNEFLQNTDASDPYSFGQCGGCAYWKVIDGILYIGGSGEMWDFDNIPDASMKRALYSPWIESDFHTVIIHNGVTAIGEDAFHGARISSVIIPESVKVIKQAAFFDAKIERLVLPPTLEKVEEGILNGFSTVADTLVLSADIPYIMPYAFFGRDNAVAHTVYLTGNKPADLTALIDSCIFDVAEEGKIYYPSHWDVEDVAFVDILKSKITDKSLAQSLEMSLLHYTV